MQAIIGWFSLYNFLMIGSSEVKVPVVETQENTLQNCVETIVSHYFKPHKLLLKINVSFSLEVPTVGLDLSEEDIDFSKFSRVDFYIINTNEDIESLFQFLERFDNFNPRAKFLIIWNDLIQEKFFESASHFYISYVTVIESLSQELYTYYPYENQNVGEPNCSVIPLGPCSNFSKNLKLFGKKMPKKWNNSVLRVLYKPWEPYVVNPYTPTLKGVEIFAMETIKKLFNFETEYIYNNGNYFDEKKPETYYESYGDLMARKADVYLGALYLKRTEHRDFDVSRSYIQDSFKWVVPKARVLQRWERIILAFGFRTWLMFLGTFILFNFIYIWYLNKLKVEISSKIPIYLFAILIEIGVNLGRQQTVRNILAVWIFYCLVISTAFKSKIMFLISGTDNLSDIDSVEEIVNSNLIINIPSSYANLYDCDDAPLDKYIYTHNLPCTDFVKCLNRTAVQRDTASLVYGRYVQYRLPEFYSETGRIKIHILKDQVFLMSIHMISSKGFPIFEQLDKALMHLDANGIIDYDFDYMEMIMQLRMRAMMRMVKEDVTNGLASMALAFVLWIFGVIISLGVFCVELVCFRLKQTKIIQFCRYRFYKFISKNKRQKHTVQKHHKISKLEDELVLRVHGKIEVF